MTRIAGTRRRAAAIIVAMAVGMLAVFEALPATAQGIPRDQLRWGWAIEKNKGQLAAIAAARRSGVALPKDSAEPLVGQTQAFAGSLKAKDPSLLRELLASLSRVDDLVEGGTSAAPLEAATRAAIGEHDRALRGLIPPDVRESLRFQAAVAARLAADGADEYGEWLDGKEAADWFQAWGLVWRAGAYWQSIAPQVRRRSHQAAAEVKARMALLERVIATAVMPMRSPAQNVKIVKTLLVQAQAAYRAGTREMGVELVYAAYYDHYEKQRASAPLRAVAPDLNKRIELGLRQLRQRMHIGASRAEIDAMIAQLLLALGKAEEALKQR